MDEVGQLKAKAEETGIKIGGALRFNYRWTEFDEEQKSRGGDNLFDIFRLNMDGEYKDVIISAEYRWYSYMSVIHHGWIGYNFSDDLQGQLGVTKVPFGLLPYASHNWWFGVPYYIGLSDDYDMGLKFVYTPGPFDVQLAFFKNAEWGSAGNLERYSYDVVKALGQENEETNQANARVAYKWEHSSTCSTEFGVSGLWGQLYNSATDDSGNHWATAAHINGQYGPLNLQFEWARYMYSAENPADMTGTDIVMGAYADAYLVANAGNVYVANIAYDVPVSWGPISNLTFYNDFSLLVKDNDSYHNSAINTLGCLVTAGPVYTYIDLVMGDDMIYLGGPRDSLAQGEDQDGLNYLFNINFGYYF
ncbi:MAG: hypothetical protein KQJ78_05965 [Deltaproteobacteria bacterium]|nr:hypothetical protein [Deltaproteobacteria bacterium]